MGIGKSLTKIIAPIVMASALAFGSVKEVKAEDSVYFHLSVDADYGLGSEIARVYHVPSFMRTVPAHPDDGGRKLSAMPDSQFLIIPAGSVEGKVGIGVREFGKFDLSIGARLGLNQYSGGSKEMNYTNYPGTSIRGEGAALVYYGINILDLNYGLFARASISYIPSFFAEYSLGVPLLQAIQAVNGWDRWNDLEINDNFFADVSFLTHTFKAGLALPMILDGDESYPTIGVFAGMKIPQFLKKSALAEEMGFSMSPISFFGGLQLNFPIGN